MIKKALVAIVALSMSVATLSACAARSNNAVNSSDSSGTSSEAAGGITVEQADMVKTPTSFTVNGQEIDTTDLVMCTIGGQEVPFGVYRYYWLGYYNTYKNAGFDMTSQETFDNIKSAVEYDLVDQYGITALAVENGLVFGSEVEQDFEENYSSLLSSFGSADEYAEALQQAYLTNDAVKSYYYSAVCADAAVDFLLSDDCPFVKTQDDFLAAVDSGEFCKTLNLLVPFAAGAELTSEDLEAWDKLTVAEKNEKYSAAYSKLSDEERNAADAKAKEIADEVLEKVKSGEDFYELIAEYNLDPGMSLNDPDDITSIDGYYITKDYSFVQEYIDGAFALQENETSDLVKTNYGYHIIKRLPIDMDYINANIKEMAEEYSATYLNKTVSDYLDAIEVKYCDYYNDMDIESIK